jgi:hypothetical protein
MFTKLCDRVFVLLLLLISAMYLARDVFRCDMFSLAKSSTSYFKEKRQIKSK